MIMSFVLQPSNMGQREAQAIVDLRTCSVGVGVLVPIHRHFS